MKVLVVLLSFLFITLSCNNSKEAAHNAKTDEETTSKEETKSSIEFTTLLQEAYGGLEKNEKRIIK